MREYFENVKVELDLSNYTTKADLKNATGVNTLDFAKKIDLANLKFDADKLGIDKLKNVPSNLRNLKNKVNKLDVDKLVPVPVDLSKLSDVVKNDVVGKLVTLATNTTLIANINEVKIQITSITNLATTPALNAKINEVKNKIPNITNLATTTTALTAVQNKRLYTVNTSLLQN